MLVMWIIVFLISLFVLSKSADSFTDAAEKTGKFFGLSSILTGVLIVAIGTSIPELVTSVFGVLQGEAGILSGNVTGTVVANIFLGLGLVTLISFKTLKIKCNVIFNDLIFLLVSGVLLAITIYDGVFNFNEALIFLFGYVMYVVYSLSTREKIKKEEEEKSSNKKELNFKSILNIKKLNPSKRARYIFKLMAVLLGSLAILILSAKYTVHSLIAIANLIGLGTSVLAASVVAIGTSLPEIAVAIASVKKDNFDMAVGNIIGSNIFDIFVIFGVVGLFTNISIPQEIIYHVLPVMLGAIFVQWLVTIDKKITVTEGTLMVVVYIIFIIRIFNVF